VDELTSIIVATKNNKATINYTLESISKFATRYDTELIVVDGASSDGTLEIIRRFVKANKGRFYDALIIRDPGRSLSYARHLGFKYSTGKILVFLDGDMVLHKDFIDNFGRKVSNLEEYGVIAVPYVILKLDHYTSVFNLFINIVDEYSLKTLKPSTIPPARIFSRNVLEKLHGYPVLSRYFGEDRIVTALAILKGFKYTYIPQLKIIKIDEPYFKSYFKKHARYGEGIARDLTRVGKRVLRDHILARRLTYLNIMTPILSTIYVSKAKQVYRDAKLSDLLSLFVLKYSVDLAMFLGEVKAILSEIKTP